MALASQSRTVHARLMAGMALAAVGGFSGMLLLMGGSMEREAEALDDRRETAALATPQPAAAHYAAASSSRPGSRVPTYIRIGGPEPEPDPVALALETLRGGI